MTLVGAIFSLYNKLRASGGNMSDHIPVFRNNKNIVQDVIEPQRGKKARIAKVYKSNYMVCILEEDPFDLQEGLSSLDANF